MSILTGINLVKIYGGKNSVNSVNAINDINIEIEAGEFIGIMGASGSGKTTLLKLLSGMEKPTEGIVEIENQNINKLSEDNLALFRRRKLGFVFQDFNLLNSLTLEENIMLPMILDKKSEDILTYKCSELMHLFKIYNIHNKYPYEVSGGEKQRTAVCRALVNDPALILADEPTGNLDSKSSNLIMNYFKKINEEMKNTIILVTHDPFAASFCNKIIFIKDGRAHTQLVKKDTRSEFLNRILDYEAILRGENYDL